MTTQQDIAGLDKLIQVNDEISPDEEMAQGYSMTIIDFEYKEIINFQALQRKISAFTEGNVKWQRVSEFNEEIQFDRPGKIYAGQNIHREFLQASRKGIPMPARK